MSSRNYLINSEDASLSDKREFKAKGLSAGLERCEVKGIGDLNADIPGLQQTNSSDKKARVTAIYNHIIKGEFPESVDQRELVFGPARSDIVAPCALDEWNTAAIVVGAASSCFQAIAAPQLNINRLCVFYGVSIETVPIPVSWLIFRTGGAAGNVVAMFDLQPQNTRLAYDAFFSEPVVYDPQEVFAVQVLGRIAGPAARVCLHNFLFGPAGQTVL